MKRSLVSREIRRVAFLHLSLGVQGLTACGGNASLGPGAGPGAADASLDAVAATDGPSCSVTSQTPSGGGPGSCDLYDFNFSGSVALCGADDAGNLPQARCFELCPPNPGAAPDASTPKLSCNLSDGTGLLPAQLECFYDVYSKPSRSRTRWRVACARRSARLWRSFRASEPVPRPPGGHATHRPRRGSARRAGVGRRRMARCAIGLPRPCTRHASEDARRRSPRPLSRPAGCPDAARRAWPSGERHGARDRCRSLVGALGPVSASSCSAL
jgi:hypothetical protein